MVIFRAVEILRRSGIDACVVNLSEEGQNEQPNIGWFTSSAPIISWGQACQISADECVFVLPEDYCMAWKQDEITNTRGVLHTVQSTRRVDGTKQARHVPQPVLIMGRADFFSFGVMESFGLAAAEAMVSGCIVIGCHGGVAEEFFNPRWPYPVPPLDYLGYLQAFQQLLQDRERCPSLIDQKRQWGRQHIARNFSPTQEAQALLGIFSEILLTTKT